MNTNLLIMTNLKVKFKHKVKFNFQIFVHRVLFELHKFNQLPRLLFKLQSLHR